MMSNDARLPLRQQIGVFASRNLLPLLVVFVLSSSSSLVAGKYDFHTVALAAVVVNGLLLIPIGAHVFGRHERPDVRTAWWWRMRWPLLAVIGAAPLVALVWSAP